MQLSINKKNTLLAAVLVVAFILVIIFAVFKFNLIQKINQPKPPTWMPPYFWPMGIELKDYKVEEPASFVLRKGEEYQAGKSYEVNKPYKDMVGEIISAMSANGWLATTGTQQDEKRTVLKINNGKETLFIEVKKITDEKSLVIFVPVVKNK